MIQPLDSADALEVRALFCDFIARLPETAGSRIAGTGIELFTDPAVPGQAFIEMTRAPGADGSAPKVARFVLSAAHWIPWNGGKWSLPPTEVKAVVFEYSLQAWSRA